MKTKILGKNALSLENNGELALFFLGTGSAFSKGNYQTNLLIIKGKDHVLVDCGTNCPVAMFSYKSSITSIRNILVTHSHADHIGGLEEAGLMGRYVTKSKPAIIVTDEYRDFLWEHSLKGGLAYGERINGNPLEFGDLFMHLPPQLIQTTPRPLYEIEIGSINIKLYRTMHIPDCAQSWEDSYLSYGLIIDDRIMFSSDTRFDPELIQWLQNSFKGIEYYFHDCQFFDGGVHASINELATLDPQIKERMFLCHYGDNYSQINAKEKGFAGFAQRGCYYIFD